MKSTSAAIAIVLALLVGCTGTQTKETGSSESVRDAPGWFRAACGLPLKYLKRIERGTYRPRSPDVQVVPAAPNFFGGFGPTSHSGPWPYLQRVPFVLYGPGHVPALGNISPNRAVTVADIAPTVAELLGMTWPDRRAGSALPEALLPPDERPVAPRLVLLIAWDGGGWNVLNRYPKAWPNLHELIDNGVSVTNAIVGSSPSVTPAIHASIGTGTWPSQHGIVDIPLRDGDKIFDSWTGRSPKYMRVATLADLWDEATGNAAEIGSLSYKAWHIAMIGHGSYREDGDKDIAVIAERKTGGQLVTNTRYYSMPAYLRDVKGLQQDIRKLDLTDGERDFTWLGNQILDDPEDVMKTPAWVLFQTRLIKHLLEGEGFGADETTDFFATNYKQVDEAGHTWNMVEPEVRATLSYTDAALGKLVTFLDTHVGQGEYVIALTADHGQTPHPRTTGAWPINIEQMRGAVARHFNVPADDLFDDERVTGFWLNPEVLRSKGITEGAVSQFLMGHTIRANNPPEQDVPPEYRDRLSERVFEAVFPTGRLAGIIECAEARA